MIKKFIRSILSRWKLETPLALQSHEWHEWKIKTKKRHPIKYWLEWELPVLVSVNYRIFITDPIWNLKYSFLKNHQYHISRPKTLKPNYHDPRTRILHVCMHELCEFWEHRREVIKERQHIPEEQEEEHIEAIDQHWRDAEKIMKEVYDYWTMERKTLQDKSKNAISDDIHDKLKEKFGSTSYIFDASKQNDPDIKKYRRGLDKMRKIDDLISKKDAQNLRKIIKIREYLWY